MRYLTVGTNPPPLDTKIIIKKAVGDFKFDDCARIHTLDSSLWSQESAVEWLTSHKLTLWAAV